jgi:hypothetical protein
MISDLDSLGVGMASVNGRQRTAVHADKSPERTGWELLAWAVLEQAVDDLANYCRWGIVTPEGKCLPWPSEIKRKIKWTWTGPQLSWVRVPRNIGTSRGPNDHKALKAWFLSQDAQDFCELIGCNLPAREIFTSTVKNHGGLNHVA